MKAIKEERLKAIKSFCKIIDNYEGEITIKNGKIYNSNNKIIYEFKL